jgi:spore germination protein
MARLRFSAWFNPLDPRAWESFRNQSRFLARLYPAWYVCSPAGAPLRRSDSKAAQRQAVTLEAGAQATEVWPVISNWSFPHDGFDAGVLRLVINDGATRRMHIARLIELVRGDGAQGVCLGYEGLDGLDAKAYSAFAEELCAAFHAAGLKVGIPVQEAAESQDWGRLGAAADCLQIQCTDLHSMATVPGPLAPPDWVKAVTARALRSVGADHLEVILPGHGYAWGRFAPTVLLDWALWDALRQARQPERRDPATVELTLNGLDVWYNDSISLAAKLYQIRDLGVDQVSLAMLGLEDPRLWALLDTLPDPFLRK